NAFKFTERGKVKIAVYPIKEEEDTEWLQIAIIDTGIGISEDQIESIFDEFIQSGTTTHSQFAGSGLGLTITKQLIHLLGGSLKLESTHGKGTSIICEIPLKQSSSQQNHLDENEVQTVKLPKKALIFDDDSSMLTVLKELLASINIEVIAYTNYKDIKDQPFAYDFVLTDIQMPEVDGFKILENLQEKGMLNYNLQPIIAMTGNTELPTKHYTNLGFAAVLKKPFTLDILVKTLQGFIPKWKVKSSITNLPTKTGEKGSHLYSLHQLEIFLDSKESIEEILEVFKKETVNNMELLKAAINISDYSQIEHVAHKMKTMAKQIEAQQILPILYDLDSPLVNKFSNEVLLKKYKQLEVEFTRLFKAIQQNQ